MKLLQLLLRELELDPPKHQQIPLITPLESHNQIKNIITLPFHLEQFILFGLLSCLNAFLRLLVILPIKLILNTLLLLNSLRNQFKTHRNTIIITNKAIKDLIFTLLIIIATITCNKIDTSRIYHNIRAQSSIKLYVLFGVLEISDKLLGTVGQDLLNYVLKQTPNSSNVVIFTLFFVSGAAYLSLHTMVLIYQTIALNVAANSYSNSLLTLLLSNQFAEIKAAVFKRIDREGLFQMSCSDIVERFQLLIMLSIISLRNLVQVGNGIEFQQGLLPYSISWNYKILGVMFGPTAFVIGSELLVDWIKHSYVCKFNKIKSKIYKEKFITILSNDVIDNFNHQTDENLQQRLGLPLPSLFILFIVMSFPSLKWCLIDSNGNIMILNIMIMLFVFGILLIFKLLLELILLKWANNIHRSSKKAMIKHAAEQADDYLEGELNNGSAIINNEIRADLYDNPDSVPPSLRKQRETKDKKSDLTKVTRYQMFSKRIW